MRTMSRLMFLALVALFISSSIWAQKVASPPPRAADAPTTAAFGEIPRDATALCVDHTWSSSRKRSGACSSHGGIKTWFGKPPRGATARCNDGTYTKSAGQGTCSNHGGVAYALKESK